MKLFTDITETSFFKTDNHIKNLHAIEINSIEEFVFKYSLDPMVLLGAKELSVQRFDELVSVSSNNEPGLDACYMQIDFVSDMKLLDILVEISKYVRIDSDFMTDLKESCVFSSIEHDYINDDAAERWVITSLDDSRKLSIVIDENEESTLFF